MAYDGYTAGVQWIYLVVIVATLTFQLTVGVAVYRVARKVDFFILFLSDVGSANR